MLWLMRLPLFILALLLAPLPAYAGQAEAKELARNYNCAVTGVTEQSKAVGEAEITTYKVNCLLPASTSAEQQKSNGSLLIRCSAALCSLLKKGE
jgi:hypothetical protein